jgi:hypothetical protein
MAEAAAIGTVASLASLGLGAASTISKGSGEQAAADFKADQADRAAEFGRYQADLTDTTLRERLTTTLGNIDAIRSAANIDPWSPTTAAIRDRNTVLSDRQRMAQVTSIKSQADADEASAAFLRKSGAFAMKQSYLQAATGVLGGVGKAFGPGGSMAGG